MNIEILELFANIFTDSLKMLQEEIEENHENLHTLNQVENLVDRWNNLYDDLFGSDENE